MYNIYGQSLAPNMHSLKINMIAYFENLTIGLHILYILNTLVKFHSNWMLFTI